LISPPGTRVSRMADSWEIIEGFVGHKASKAPANLAGEVRKQDPRILYVRIFLNSMLVPLRLRQTERINRRHAPHGSTFKYSGSRGMGRH
jgi:hypothetical protein